MTRWLLYLLVGVGILAMALLTGPFLIPVPPLQDTVPPHERADPDSQFIELEDLQVHYKVAGVGDPSLILLHGFAASAFSWREVLGPLADIGTVVAFDRPAFGLTERPLHGEWHGDNPYMPEFQATPTILLMDALGIERAILVGHSTRGAVSTLTALTHPERVQALVLVVAAIYGGGSSPGFVRPLLSTPQMRRVGPLIARRIQTRGCDFGRRAWHDPTQITPDVWEGYLRPLQTQNWDRALWELTVAGRPSNLADRLDDITVPVLVITGDDDRIVPAGQSIRLAKALPNAELVVIPDCGHVPHEECPELFLKAMRGFPDRF